HSRSSENKFSEFRMHYVSSVSRFTKGRRLLHSAHGMNQSIIPTSARSAAVVSKSPRNARSLISNSDIDCFRPATAPRYNIETHHVVLAHLRIVCDSAGMKKYIFGAIGGDDETEAPDRVVEFHCASH